MYVINLSPSKGLPQKTPAEAWYGIKPDIGNMRIFGSTAWTHTVEELRTKIDANAKECVMVGYDPNGYRLWDPIDGTIRSARERSSIT